MQTKQTFRHLLFEKGWIFFLFGDIWQRTRKNKFNAILRFFISRVLGETNNYLWYILIHATMDYMPFAFKSSYFYWKSANWSLLRWIMDKVRIFLLNYFFPGSSHSVFLFEFVSPVFWYVFPSLDTIRIARIWLHFKFDVNFACLFHMRPPFAARYALFASRVFSPDSWRHNQRWTGFCSRKLKWTCVLYCKREIHTRVSERERERQGGL